MRFDSSQRVLRVELSLYRGWLVRRVGRLSLEVSRQNVVELKVATCNAKQE